MSRPYFVHIRHTQSVPHLSGEAKSKTTKGGITLAIIGDADNGFRYGVAKCSIKDNYCKSKGRQLSTGRAFEKKTSLSLPDDIITTKAAEQHLRQLYTV